MCVNASDQSGDQQILCSAFEQLPVGALIAGSDGTVLWANTRLAELTGYGVDELTGQPAGRLDAEPEGTGLREAISSAKAWEGEVSLRRKTEESRRVIWRTAPIEGAAAVVCTAEDLAGHRQVQDELRASKARLRIAMDLVKLVHWEYDVKSDLYTFDDHFYALHGTTAEREGGTTMRSAVYAERFMPPEEIPMVRLEIAEALASTDPGYSKQLEHRIRRADGDERHIAVRLRIVKDEAGNTIRIYGANQDITERKRAEEVLRKSEERYRSLFENMSEGFALCKMIFEDGEPVDFVYLNVNKCFEPLTGLKDIVGKRVTKAVPGIRETNPELFEIYGRVALSGNPEKFETYVVPMGVWFSITVYSPAREYFVAVFEVITERKRAEAALKASESKYRAVVEKMQEVYYRTDMQGKLLMASPSAARVLGVESVEQLYGKNLVSDGFVTQEETDEFFAAMDAKGMVHDHDALLRRPDGRVLSITMNSQLYYDADGTPLGVEGVFRDITERKRAEREKTLLEEQLRQAQKLESVGRLAGGIAHDFNNLLTVINGYSTILLRGMGPQDPLRGFAEQISTAGERAAGLTKQLLAFSRKQVIQPRPLDLNSVVKDAESMLRRLIGEDIELVTVQDPSLGLTMADPDQIHQVLMNLAVNAHDAMPDGGKLIIETANVESDGYVALHPEATKGSYVLLTVTDTGTGMSAEIRQRVFEPFFTTKEQGKGTGLGLSTVYGIVKQSGGWIWVYSEPGQGSAFKIYLPRVEACPLPAGGIETNASDFKGSETILLVEDNEGVRSLASSVLGERGYRALEAADGAEALELAQSYKGPIHLLLTDVVLPGMNGRQLADAMRVVRPGTKVLYISGYTAEVIAQRGVLEHGVAYLPKPFSPSDLAAKVREVLADSSASPR